RRRPCRCDDHDDLRRGGGGGVGAARVAAAGERGGEHGGSDERRELEHGRLLLGAPGQEQVWLGQAAGPAPQWAPRQVLQAAPMVLHSMAQLFWMQALTAPKGAEAEGQEPTMHFCQQAPTSI